MVRAAKLLPILSLLLLLTPMAVQGTEAMPMTTHYKHVGPGFDIYLPQSANMNFAELLFIVNYGEEPLIVNITGEIYGGEKQYGLWEIEPGSSAIVEAVFLDVGADYELWVGREGQPLLIVPLGREVGEYVPPPGGGWYWVPTDEAQPPVYSQEEWDEMVASFRALVAAITLEAVLLAALATMAGAAVAIGVKGRMRFVAPTDPVSMLLFIIAGADIVLGLTPVGAYWVPALFGYVIAYVIYHIQWVGKGTIDYGSQTVKVTPYVTYYTEDGQLAIQEQTWRGLLARMTGHHHLLGTDGALAENWVCAVKKPYWPLISSRLLWVEKEETETEAERGRLLTIKKKVSRWILADASTARKIDLLTKAELLLEHNEERRRDKMELVRLRADKEASALKSVGRIFREVQHYSVLSSLDDLTADDPSQRLPEKEGLSKTDKVETETKKAEKED